MAPEVAAGAMRTYAEETNRLNHERRATLAADRAELAAIPQKIAEIITMIDNGGGTRAMVDRLRELEAREDELNERLAQAPADIPDLHPNFAGIYRQKVERLTEALQRPEERDEAAAAIRDIIVRITLSPGPGRGEIDATLHGDFRTILEWTHHRKSKADTPGLGVSASVVAGARNRLCRNRI